MNRQYDNFDLVVNDPLDAVPRGPAIGVADVVLFLRRRWLLIAGIAAVIVLAAGALLTTIAPRYVATAELALVDQRQQSTPIADLVTGVPLSRQLVQQEIITMQSKAFMIAVVKRLESEPGGLDLGSPPRPIWPVRVVGRLKRFVSGLVSPTAPTADAASVASNDPDTDQQQEDVFAILAADLAQYGDTADQLRSMIGIAQVGNSYVISVSAQSTDPALAARLANTTAAEYTRFSLNIRGEAIEDQVRLLRDRVDDLGRNLEEAENAVVDFQQQVMGSDSASNNLLTSQISDLSQRLVDARADVVAARAQYEKLSEVIEDQGAINASNVLTSPILANVREELSQLRIDRSRAVELFGEESTQVSGIDAVISRISDELRIETGRILSQYETELNVALTVAAGINADLFALEDTLRSRSRNALELDKLRRIADANRVAYEEFLTLATESAQYRSLQQSSVRFLSYAEVPKSPSAPRSLLLLAMAGLGGLVTGLGIAILLEVLNTKIRTERELRHISGLPVIGSFSRTGGEGSRRSAGGHDRTDSTLLAEGQAVSSFLLNVMEHDKGIVLVTSAVGDEGSPKVARLFADTLARQDEAVLLIDARSDVADGPLTLGGGLEQLIDNVDGVPTLTLAQVAHTSPQLLPEKRKLALMAEIAGKYDYVVIDAPPVLSSAVALRFVRDADAIVITTRWNATARDSVQACVQKLRDLAAENMYVVMTGVNRRAARKFEHTGAGRTIKPVRVRP